MDLIIKDMEENLLPIRTIADKLAISEDYLDYYGKYTAKLRLDLLSSSRIEPDGKLILVTAITPTNHGEGKTVVSIGLAQALEQLGKKAIVTLREPSLGPTFGEKGGATGGGKSMVIPSEKINLHFNGDFPAVTAAHNLLAAIIDSHIHHGNDLKIDINNIFWPRTLDINDRTLRHLIVGLGGKANGVPRETEFVISAASEMMAILALANSHQDLRNRLSDIVIGLDLNGDIVQTKDLKITGALMALLNEAIMPNLVQTTEHTPAMVHTGPFANIAHGTCSVISQKMSLRLADYVVNETGFGADLGIEKYCDIVMPSSGLKPSAAVLVVTVKALLSQGTDAIKAAVLPTALERGFDNLNKHIENLKRYRLPFIVAINRFPSDTNAEIKIVVDYCREIGVECAVVEVFDQGGKGALELASKVTTIIKRSAPLEVVSLYPPNLGLEEKIEIIAKEIYGAGSINIESIAHKKLSKFSEWGFSHLPICIAKTPSSFSDNPKLFGAPKGWTLTITDVRLFAGAKFIVAMAGNILLMPGLSKYPRAVRMDVDYSGHIVMNGQTRS